MLYKCPFKYKRKDPVSGVVSVGVGGKKDGYNDIFCGTGKGSWCLYCKHYQQYKVSQTEWDKRFNEMKKTGKAPWVRKKVSKDLLNVKI